MKKITSLVVTGFILFTSSCNNGEEKKEETKPAADTSAVVVAPPAEPAFSPFKLIMIKHKVKEYGKWKEGYMAHDSMRQAYGISHYKLGRGLDDSNMVIIMDKIADVQKAKEFAALPNLKMAMKNAGVISSPEFAYTEVIRLADIKTDIKDRLFIKHKVKDFDTWLKAYDADLVNRKENGIIDRGLARGIDDPNMIYIVFVVSDIAKAKARASSEELKKIMTDAGVQGPPEIFFYRLDD